MSKIWGEETETHHLTCSEWRRGPYRLSWPLRTCGWSWGAGEQSPGPPCQATVCTGTARLSARCSAPSDSPACQAHMKCCWNASWTVSGHRKVFCWLLAEAAPFWCRCSSKSRFSGCNGPIPCCSSESPGNSRRPAARLWASTGHTSSGEACQKRQNTSGAHVKQQQNADIFEDVNRKLTLPFSTSLVIMMITPTFCSQIIRQKSSVLDFRGPWAAM